MRSPIYWIYGRIAALMIWTLAFSLQPRVAAAETVNLPCDGTTFVSAVNSAASGTILTLPDGCVIELTQPPANLVGRALTVVGRGRGATIARSSGSPAFTLFYVATGSHVTLSNLTLRGGHGLRAYFPGVPIAGAIGVFKSTLLLLDTTIHDNVAGDGNGGMAGPGIRAPAEGGCGGGIAANNATVTLIGSTVSGNSAGTGASVPQRVGRGGHGGGICVYASSSLTLVNSTVSGNKAGDGGSNGGCLGCTTPPPAGDGGWGGGIVSENSSVVLLNSTISNNRPGAGHPSVYPTAPSGKEGFGGGIALLSGALTLRNTIVLHNLTFDGVGPNDCVGAMSSGGYNLFGINTGCPATATDRTADPERSAEVLGPLTLAESAPAVHPLIAKSPAIDGGDPAGCRNEMGALLAEDQRGTLRPLDGDADGMAVCDVGAYEWMPTLFLPFVARP